MHPLYSRHMASIHKTLGPRKMCQEKMNDFPNWRGGECFPRGRTV